MGLSPQAEGLMRRTSVTSLLLLLVWMTQALAVSAADSVGDTAPDAALTASACVIQTRSRSKEVTEVRRMSPSACGDNPNTLRAPYLTS